MMIRPYPIGMHNGRFFVWQTHMYGTGNIDSIGPADVFMRRNIPATPAGDLVFSCETGAQAEQLATYLNDQHRITLDDAIAYARSQVFTVKFVQEKENNQERSSRRFDAFVAELRSLCRKHGVVISASGYDGLEVWNANGQIEHEDPIYCGDIQNCISD